MKYNIDGVIIVEGKSDVCYLSSFLNCLYFTTNGVDLSAEKLSFLKRAAEVNKLIIMSDDDPAGEKIRSKIKSEINGVFDIKIPKNSRKSYKKQGIAESKKEPIFAALKPFLLEKPVEWPDYELTTLISLANDPREAKATIIRECRLLKGNNKSLENQLRILKIDKEKVWKLIAPTSMK